VQFGKGARSGQAMFQSRDHGQTVASRINRSYVRRRDARKPVVLVIDDCAEARDLYCAYLEFHGFGAETAEDGPSGIASAVALGPDAIVLDFSMPRMDGAEVLRRLKADARTRSIPVVMVTAVPELVDREARGACAAFLEKPCEPDRLMETLDELTPSESPLGRESDRSGA
jgi:CheY-like chemotaxis protein